MVVVSLSPSQPRERPAHKTCAREVQYGETLVQATLVQSKTEREGVDFFPLMVELDEKLYAAGIIKGSRWVKREGRPTDQAVLTGRMIDRAIRPLFTPGDNRDVQIIIHLGGMLRMPALHAAGTLRQLTLRR